MPVKQPPKTETAQDALLDDIDRAMINIERDGDFKHINKYIRGALQDGFILGLLATRTAGLVSLPAIYSGLKPGVKRMQEIGGDGLERFSKYFPLKEQTLVLRDAILGGGIAEILRTDENGKVVDPTKVSNFDKLPVLKVVHRSQELLKVSPVDGSISYNKEPIQPGDGRWLVMLPAMERPWRAGIWAALCRARAEKYLGTMHSLAFMQGIANSVVVITTTAKDRAEAQQAAISWGELAINNVRVVKEGEKADLLEVKSGVGSATFDTAIARAKDDASLIVCGQTVTPTGGSGSGFQNIKYFRDISRSLIVEDAAMFSGMVDEQLMPWLERGVSRRLDLTDTTQKASEANLFVTSASAIKGLNEALTGDDLQVDVPQLTEQFSIPTVKRKKPKEAAPPPPPQDPQPNQEPPSNDANTEDTPKP
ncbi:MAG: phage portal protein family protein [Microbacteriaceae bacterium]